MATKTAAEYAAEFKARKAALRARVAHNALNGIVTAGERAILDQERAENAMGEALSTRQTPGEQETRNEYPG